MRPTFPAPIAILVLASVGLGCTPAGQAPMQEAAADGPQQPTATSHAASAASPPLSEPKSPADDARVRARRAAAKAAESQLDFGQIPLGTPITSLPRGAKWNGGPCDPSLLEGCGFDLNGVGYGTFWEDNIVTVKTIEVGAEPPRWLPFGLRGDETMDVALAHLNARFGGAFEIGANDAGETFVLAWSENEREEFEVSLSFERNGRLSEIRASCCYN